MLLFTLMVMEEQSLIHREKIALNEEIFIKISHGDKAAFEELYLGTKKALYAFVFSMTKDVHVTNDVLSETYVKVRSAAHLYRPMGKPLAWMFTIAKRLVLSQHRKNSRETFFEEKEFSSKEFSYVSDPTMKLVLEAALNILSEEEREIVLLHTSGGLKHREIANSLSIPLSTVLSKYHRSLVKLKNYLAKEGEPL